ncbi:hypothetical protein A2392_02885 [Candidatus Kaiserbacteria bacterium RIFOXYB1_FULL_46_14]|uniref:Aminotransferase class V domain-containing protein n=1 Tax=Candidatus Kaiserbacteria bacterium RIFOXYB1_FULL_46_14 TaxID=1798531 RepID=A0A1F6FIT5_9BACT|nr:MAG: hypothetical protein A2392_02885 [Candidatus Kaiserbacteria bacterium RIFOXYB1_FULL_46_14]
MLNNWFKRRVYLDYAAATPARNEVLKAMSPFWSDRYGNPGAIHTAGVLAKSAVEEARETVARTLRVRATDIIFTSGGTESNNLAIRGAVRAMRLANVPATDIEIISTAIEHPSVSECLKRLIEEGVRVIYAPIDTEGKVIAEEFKKLLSHRTRLVTIAYANSETGVVQDISRLSRMVRMFEKENGLTIPFHTDAAQAPRWLPCALDSLGVDMMSLDAGKCEGPKGVGVLVKRSRVALSSITGGGGQEFKLRPGTEPVPLIVGAATAISLAQKEHESKSAAASKLRDRWIKELTKLPGVLLNGSATERLPNNVNISLPGFDTEFAVVVLDAAGIAASTKSACSASGSGRSHVVYTMTGDEARAASTIRFTLGPETSWRDLKQTTHALRKHIEKMHQSGLTV